MAAWPFQHIPESSPIAALASPLLTGEAPPLVPDKPRDAALKTRLAAIREAELFGDAPIRDAHMAACVLSGLLLWNDSLDESHTLSQGIKTTTGSYWHGIMHRREPDYDNAKYWFRNVGGHELFKSLHESAAPLLQDTPAAELVTAKAWDPFRMVDLCEEAAGGKGDLDRALRAAQLLEIQLLLDYCYARAI